jgi:hypothetical protein
MGEDESLELLRGQGSRNLLRYSVFFMGALLRRLDRIDLLPNLLGAAKPKT